MIVGDELLDRLGPLDFHSSDLITPSERTVARLEGDTVYSARKSRLYSIT
jgi:hypothetical protein